MRSYATSGLLATLSYPPWTESLNREIYMTPDGEEQIPFNAYIQPSSDTTAPRHGETF
jgi:hypothetical protein